MIREIAEGVGFGLGRGMADAVLDRIVVTPGMVERVQRWFK